MKVRLKLDDWPVNDAGYSAMRSPGRLTNMLAAK
jgi:hypothetical protein